MNKIKEFFAHLKHIFKDPIKNLDEAEKRKKEIMPLLYISLGILVIGALLATLLELGFLHIITLIGIVGAVAFGFLLMVIGKAKKKFQALTCDGCGHLLDIDTVEQYKELVSYEILSEDCKWKLSHPASDDKGIVSSVKCSGQSVAVLAVTFKCPECGATKTFKYQIEPFSCLAEQTKVHARDVEIVKMNLENKMKAVMDEYASGDRTKIPYTIHSVHHPDYENRSKPQLMNTYPHVNGVRINYHREIEELVEGLFIHNELNGTIITDK